MTFGGFKKHLSNLAIQHPMWLLQSGGTLTHMLVEKGSFMQIEGDSLDSKGSTARFSSGLV
jgi:hypothetical protein